jgi:hypothetical protein
MAMLQRPILGGDSRRDLADDSFRLANPPCSLLPSCIRYAAHYEVATSLQGFADQSLQPVQHFLSDPCRPAVLPSQSVDFCSATRDGRQQGSHDRSGSHLITIPGRPQQA